MRPSEIRQHVLRDHEELRERLERLENRARDILEARAQSPAALREQAERLLERLATHMSWEDRYLLPVLRQADSCDDTRTRKFTSDHIEQRELLEYALRKLHDAERPDVVVASNLLDLVELLREDMLEEEAIFLDEAIVHDDPIAIDLSAG